MKKIEFEAEALRVTMMHFGVYDLRLRSALAQAVADKFIGVTGKRVRVTVEVIEPDAKET